MHTIQLILQVGIALILLNVWLLRFGKATAWRGGAASNMREEFAAYGLPSGVMYLVGFLKVLCALLLLAGIWVPVVTVPAASVIALLMLGAVGMHFKIGDPPRKSLPAATLLICALLVIV